MLNYHGSPLSSLSLSKQQQQILRSSSSASVSTVEMDNRSSQLMIHGTNPNYANRSNARPVDINLEQNQEIMMERDMLRMENDRLRQRLQEAEGMIGQLLLENQRFQTQRNGNYNNNSNSSSVTRYHKNVSGSPSPKLELARTASCSTDWDCDDSYSTEDCPFFGASGWSGGSSSVSTGSAFNFDDYGRVQ